VTLHNRGETIAAADADEGAVFTLTWPRVT
jgi:hypothetical protein